MANANENKGGNAKENKFEMLLNSIKNNIKNIEENKSASETISLKEMAIVNNLLNDVAIDEEEEKEIASVNANAEEIVNKCTWYFDKSGSIKLSKKAYVALEKLGYNLENITKYNYISRKNGAYMQIGKTLVNHPEIFYFDMQKTAQ